MTTLMAYFEYNRIHNDCLHVLYQNFPEVCVWNDKSRRWQRRKQGRAIGRIYHCSPVAGERFYLRLLLTSVAGSKSFEDLYFYEDRRYPTYQAACIARGLAEDDKEWERCFNESKLFASGHSLRILFLTGLRFRHFADPLALWDQFKVYICDDLPRKFRQGYIISPPGLVDLHLDYGLWLLEQGLADLFQTLFNHGLPRPVHNWTSQHQASGQAYQPTQEASIGAEMLAQLNTDQRKCFDTILAAVTDDPQTAHFYLQGPGGTGKTFLYKTLCHYYRGLGKSVVCVASTGIAALLLPGGRTSHSQFKIPIELTETSICNVSKSSDAARLLLKADLIIWDEVPMQHKNCFHAVHRLLCDLRDSPEDGPLFAGIPSIFGGDFAQTLPVVKKGSRASIVQACLQKSMLWPKLRKLHLTINMRVRNGMHDEGFVQWLHDLSYKSELHTSISLPSYISQPNSIEDLINAVYPLTVLQAASQDRSWFRSRALLTTLNSTVKELNSTILPRYPGALKTYLSTDTADTSESSEGDVEPISAEVLHTIDLASLPPSKLELKVGAPIMVLRNLCPQEGLCNGTRMIVTALRGYSIEAKIIGGEFDGQSRTIPRIKLESADTDLTWRLTRKQFPVRLCFAMTINKSQGQSFETVGIDFRSPAFCHGQFYVAMSRTSSVAGLHVLLTNLETRRTENVVYPEVLQDINM